MIRRMCNFNISRALELNNDSQQNAHMPNFTTLPLHTVIMYYISDSQPGVGVLPGVRTRTFRDTRKRLNNGGKRQVIGVCMYSYSYSYSM